jgi:hypothetical protein
MIDEQTLIERVHHGDPDQLTGLADEVARWDDLAGSGLIPALEDGRVRRWVRQELLRRLDADRQSWLAGKLLDWSEDFDPARRDRSMASLVESLADEQIQGARRLLAGSNAAGAFWERLSRSGEMAVMRSAEFVLDAGDVRTRETTLHLLVLDPYGPGYLSHTSQDALLVRVLYDPDPEIRGLAAEVVAAEQAEVLLARWETALLDESERVRMAFWRAALAYQPELAIETAQQLVLAPERSHPARRTALLALGEIAPTGDVSPVLQVVLRGDDEVLAGDAADLMWRFHRTPDVANAAAESQFDDVRDRANRLLHPEMGSPAAGGSRPGDPTRTQEIFEQITPRKEDESSSGN